ncbi:MAG: NAD(P)H-hydrate epimerase, partial [Bacteroidota bacterium]
MQILTAPQLRALDEATVLEHGITSTDLMERASQAFVRAFRGHFGPEHPVAILCGTGNNGGDGLAVARMLDLRYNVTVLAAQVGRRSSDNMINYRRAGRAGCKTLDLKVGDSFPHLREGAVLIDALFGTGLSRPLEGYWAELVVHFNEQRYPTVALDLPSGLLPDQSTEGAVLRADRTITLGLPKLALFAPENTKHVGQWEVAPFPLSDPASV